MIQEFEDSLQFLEKLGIDTKDAQVLDDLRLLRSPPSIVFVGLINRGKSSLINQIIGAEVLPTGINPETFACTILQTSKIEPFLSYAKLADQTVESFSDKSDFVEHVSRKKSNLKFQEAHVRFKCRLPDGFALIDTPGCNDISVDYEKELTALEQTWQKHGAMAGVLVSSVPPGVSGQDVKLLHALKRRFGSRVAVVLKQTQSSLTFEDLENAAGVWLQHGVTAIIISDDSAPNGVEWGSGRLSELENALSLMWNDGGSAKLEASERLTAYLELQGRKMLQLSSIFNPGSESARDLVLGAMDRPNLVNSLKKLANEKIVIDYESQSKSSREIKNYDQVFLAIEVAIRGSKIASKSLLSIVAREAGIESLQHGDLVAQLVMRNSDELNTIVMKYTPGGRDFALGELRRGIDSLPSDSRARAVALLKHGINRLIKDTSSEERMTRIAENFGSFYPREVLSNFVRIWGDPSTPIDGYRNLSSLIQEIASHTSPDFLDDLSKNTYSELLLIRSCTSEKRPTKIILGSLPIGGTMFGSAGPMPFDTNPLYQARYEPSLSTEKTATKLAQRFETSWLIDLDVNKLVQVEQWNLKVIRFCRGILMFDDLLGTTVRQLTNNILSDHIAGDFGKWISISRELIDAIKNGEFDRALNGGHSIAFWVLGSLGLIGLLTGSAYAFGLLLCSALISLRKWVIGDESFMNVKSFQVGKSFRGAKFQLIQTLTVEALIFFTLLVVTS